jgi:hypothetical protein
MPIASARTRARIISLKPKRTLSRWRADPVAELHIVTAMWTDLVRPLYDAAADWALVACSALPIEPQRRQRDHQKSD